MKRWERRALAYRTIGALPFGGRLFDALCTRFGSLKHFDLDGRWYIVTEFGRMMRGAELRISGKAFIEIGSGWHPLLPIVFVGLGAGRVVMTDTSSHLRPEFVLSTIEYCLRRSSEIALAFGSEPTAFHSRVEKLLANPRDILKGLEACGVEYRAPLDFTECPFGDGEFDGVFSNSCLCYIPFTILEGIFRESARIVRPGGNMIHNVSVYDDYSRPGAGSSIVNFLSYSEADWNVIGNSQLHFQNRLRPSSYVTLAVDAGFDVVYEERTFDSSGEFELDRGGLHPEFQDLPEEELLCHHFLMAARKSIPESVELH